MSTPFGETPIGGRPGAVPPASEGAPLPAAQERFVSLEELGLKPKQPDIQASAPAPRATVAVPSGGPRLAELLDAEDDDDEQPTAQGAGPRFVVLHDYVIGHTRGQVVWASDLLKVGRPADANGHVPSGLDLFREAASDTDTVARPARILIRRQLKRLLDSGAIREANSAEAGYTFVRFVETHEEAEDELVKAQSRVAALEDTVTALRRQLETNQGTLQDKGPFDDEAEERERAVREAEERMRLARGTIGAAVPPPGTQSL